ncbi:hypothetical protein C1O63_0594 [Dehalococcoides mccartyi]|nr:hypothetical protein C1O63_0594 [Dehalococcoides mccartyi]
MPTRHLIYFFSFITVYMIGSRGVKIKKKLKAKANVINL